MINITEELIQKIENMLIPFSSDMDIYNYLKSTNHIDWGYRKHRDMLAEYRKTIQEGEIEYDVDTKKGAIKALEHKLAEVLQYMKTKHISLAKATLAKQIQSDTNVAKWWLEKYDRKEKKFNERIKKSNIDINNTVISDTNMNKELIIAITRLETDINNFFKLANKQNILEVDSKYIHFEGGRSGGKSINTGQIVILRMLKAEIAEVILCAREIQNTLEDSVHATLKYIITKYDIEKFFDITDKKIVCKHNQARTKYMGLKSGTSDSSEAIKSIPNLYLCWIEEAQSISEYSIDKVIPSIIRNKGSQIIYTYNRNKISTPVYDYEFDAQGNAYKDNVTHININYWDNKYLDEEAIKEAEFMKVNNRKKWDWVYGGLPQTEFKNALWNYEDIQSMVLNIKYDRDNYVTTIIAVDPATSSTDFSNEYGIIVLGLTHEKIVHILDDYSDVYKTKEFASKVNEAYQKYECDFCVYESNAGGEHIAHTIISENPYIKLESVTAKTSKYMRALPIANFTSQGRISLIKAFKRLQDQMILMTSNGFEGNRGESPDRLDAFVWGCYKLLNIKDMNTAETYFKITDFKEPLVIKDNPRYYKIKDFMYITLNDNNVTLLTAYSVHHYDTNTSHIVLTNIQEVELVALNKSFIVPDIEIYLNDKNIIDTDKIGIDYSMVTKLDFDTDLIDVVTKSLAYIRDDFIRIDNKIKNVIIDNVCSFVYDEPTDNHVLKAICEFIAYEKGLIDYG